MATSKQTYTHLHNALLLVYGLAPIIRKQIYTRSLVWVPPCLSQWSALQIFAWSDSTLNTVSLTGKKLVLSGHRVWGPPHHYTSHPLTWSLIFHQLPCIIVNTTKEQKVWEEQSYKLYIKFVIHCVYFHYAHTHTQLELRCLEHKITHSNMKYSVV